MDQIVLNQSFLSYFYPTKLYLLYAKRPCTRYRKDKINRVLTRTGAFL